MKRKLALTISIVFALLGVALASAQTANPELILSWQTDSYTPTSYYGKDLATESAVLTAAVALLDQGLAADLSQTEIRWFLNDKLIASAIGLEKISFSIPVLTPNSQLKVLVHRYKNQSSPEKVIAIRTTDPQISIKAPDKASLSLRDLSIEALVYFLPEDQVTDTEIAWTINGLASTVVNIFDTSLIVGLDQAQEGDTLNIQAEILNPSFSRPFLKQKFIEVIK